jgi:hypothetical protein
VVEGPCEDLDEVALHHPGPERAALHRGLLVKGAGEEDVCFQGAVEGLQQRREGAHLHQPVTVHEHLPDWYGGQWAAAGLPPGDRVRGNPQLLGCFLLGEPLLLSDDPEDVAGDDASTGSPAAPLTAGQGLSRTRSQ